MKRVTTILALGLMVGCSDPDAGSTNNIQNNTTGALCPEDSTTVELPSGETACTFVKEIVIETGFVCPMPVKNRFDFTTIAACDSRPTLPIPDINFLNELDGTINNGMPTAVPATNELDLIWVLDNSGSMCQEQFGLIDEIPVFLNEIIDKGVKLRVGITTTHTDDNYPPEPVAKGGHFQSTPQPVPGFDPSCWHAADGIGGVDENDVSPVRRMLDIAIGCMETPDPTAYTWTDEEILCALRGSQCAGPSSSQELFPDPSLYRSLPLVFDTENYRNGDTYDTQQMAADLGCMSLVGTRGYGIERGLEAITLATSSALLNGPNKGFLRPDARFGVFILTDEDDCTGEIDLATSCGADVCEFAKTDSRFGSLVAVESVRNTVLANLTAHKGRPVSMREVLVASLHGQPGGTVNIPSGVECSLGQTTYVTPSCQSSFGSAYYGERYEAFLRTWSHGNQFPYSPNANVPMDGFVCDGDLSGPVQRVAEFFATYVTQ